MGVEGRVSGIVDEVRRAYAGFGIELDEPVAYGTYYRLRCAGCGKVMGNVGDRLLPGMIQDLLDRQFELYAASLLGCGCGHQAERAASLDPARAAAARDSLDGAAPV